MTDIQTIAAAIKTITDAGLSIEQAADLLEKFAGPTPVAATSVAAIGEQLPDVEHLGYRIVVLQRGWVAVGDVTRTGPDWRIDDARVIRIWGTSKGLGELVDGPTGQTKIDDYGTIHAHELGVVLSLPVKADKWAR